MSKIAVYLQAVALSRKDKVPTTRQLHLRTYPTDLPGSEHFSIETVELPNPTPGEVQVHNTFMSVDSYMRGCMRENSSHMDRYNLGEVLDGGAVGIVSVSNHGSFKPGDHVLSSLGWREAFNAPVDTLRLIDTTHLPAEAYLGIAGLTGFTAYVGITHITDVQPCDTVLSLPRQEQRAPQPARSLSQKVPR